MSHNAVYAQSGGVTAVINATAAAIARAVREEAPNIDRLFAARNGVLGLLREELYDVSALSATDLDHIRETPGGAFGSCRYKLGKDDHIEAVLDRLFEIFEAHNIGTLFYNGGNDSADTSHQLSEAALARGVDLRCIGVPKTIDNDLPFTDQCPGFASAAKYLCTSVAEASLDVAAMADTSTKLFILEVMGRHAGWLAAATGVLSKDVDDAPHLILTPEKALDMASLCEQVQAIVERIGYCVIVVSEGVRDADGNFLAASERTDSFGHAQLGGAGPTLAKELTAQLGYKHHWAVPDYLQRSARHLASAVDLEHAEAVGRAAVAAAQAGRSGVIPMIERLADSPYRWQVTEVALSEIANREHMVPAHFFRDDGLHISERARAYFQPLLAGEAYPRFKDGLPDFWHGELTLVEPRLPAWTRASIAT